MYLPVATRRISNKQCGHTQTVVLYNNNCRGTKRQPSFPARQQQLNNPTALIISSVVCDFNNYYYWSLHHGTLQQQRRITTFVEPHRFLYPVSTTTIMTKYGPTKYLSTASIGSAVENLTAASSGFTTTTTTSTTETDDDPTGRNHRKILLDAINHIVKKRKHFWTIDELNIQTQRLIDYCNDRDDGNDSTSTVKKNNQTGSGGPNANTTGKARPNTYYKYGRPSSNNFFQVLEAWMERSMEMAEQPGGGTIDSAERARLLLDAMLPKRDMFQPHTTGTFSNNNTRFVQNTKLAFLQNLIQTSHYEVVLQTYAVSNAGLPAAIRAESLLSQMIQRCKLHMKKRTSSNMTQSYPTTNQRAVPSRRLAVTINNNRHDRPPEPTLKTFNIVLNGWAKSGAYEAADRINALFTFMEGWHYTYTKLTQHHRSTPYTYEECLPNERSLLCLIEAWTNGRPNEAPEVTLRILQEVMIATDHSNNRNNPINSTFDGSISTSGTSGHNSSSVGRMDGRYQNVQLDEAVFNAVIYAWVRSNRGRSAAIQAEEILQMMIQWSQVSNNSKTNRLIPVQATTRTYSMIIMAWAECETIENKGDAAERAETILMKMAQLFSKGQDNVKPNSLLFTTCIAAWSRAASNCNTAPDRAEQLWEHLRKLYAETGSNDIELEPTTQIGNAVISAWSRCSGRPDSVDRALDVLNILKQESKDDLISYNTVLDAMSKKGCAQDALKLLEWLEGPDSNRMLTPDLVSYNSVLAAFGRSSVATLRTTDGEQSSTACCVAEKAETLLRRMEQMNNLKPDKLSYTSVMNAWSRSNNPEKNFRGAALLRDMIRQYKNGDDTLKPDVYVYTTLIKTCAYSRRRTKTENVQVLQMALNALSTLENTDYGPPNDVTYATIMTAISRLSSDKSSDHDSHCESAFRRCAARGLLTNDVMLVFQRCAPVRLFRRLTNNTGQLQPEWSRNVPDHKKPVIHC